MKRDDIKKKLEEKQEYLDSFLKKFSMAQEAIPYVQKSREINQWELNVIKECPENVIVKFPDSLEEDVNIDYEFMKHALPMLPDYNMELVAGTTAVTSAGASAIYSCVNDTSKIGTPEAIEFSDKYKSKYYDLQASQERPKDVRKLIDKLQNPNTIQRFDVVNKEYYLFKAGTASRTTVAEKLRTLLDGIRGDLFNLARKNPNENMTWDTMADRITKGGPGSTEHKIVKKEGSTRSELISNLSDIFKCRDKAPIDIESVWVKSLDHIYSVLNLVKYSRSS